MKKRKQKKNPSSIPAFQHSNTPVSIIMGSQSDWDTMKHAADMLEAHANLGLRIYAGIGCYF